MKYWQLFLLFAIAAFAAVLWNLNLLSQWGLYVVAACVAGCTVVVLVNSGHLTERWMQGADLGVKVMGAVLGLIIAQWFAERDKGEQRRRDQESSAAIERSKNESKAQHDKDVAIDAEQRFAEATRTYLAALATASNAQKIYIFQSIGQALRTQSAAGIYLPLAQILLTAAQEEKDLEVNNVVRSGLPQGVPDQHIAFIDEAVLRAAKSGKSNLDKDGLMRLFVSSVAFHAADTTQRDEASKLLAGSTVALQSLPQAADSAAASQTVGTAQQIATTVATAVLETAISPAKQPGEGNTNIQQQATQTAARLLDNATAETVAAIVKKLPANKQSEIPARIYLHVASEEQRSRARELQSSLIAANYLVPGIQNVAGKGYIPDTLEVRYFDPESKSKAQEILGIIKNNGANDGRVSYVIPTANDRRISSDIKSHFEVWAGRNSF